MSKKRFKKGRIEVVKEETPTNLVVQEIRIQSADRNKKDVGEFRTALISAESVHHPNRVRLYDLYDYILIDGHLSGIMSKRVDAVLNKKLFFELNEEKSEEMEEVIESECFREVVRKIMETPAWGVSGMEFIPGKQLEFKEIPRKHIRPHKQIISIEQQGDDGIPYQNIPNLWVLGKENDLGYLLKCAPYALWKRGNMGDWAQYIEVFGQPVRVIYYDAYDTKTKMELREVLDESGSSLALMIPKQAQFEMKDGKQSNGTGELQEKFKAACDNEMSIAVLGNTESTASSQSSGYAQAKEHGKQQLEITKSDMAYVRNMLNSERFLRILKSYGYQVEGGHFKFEKEIDLDALKLRMEIDQELDTKVPLGEDYWYETYGVSKPANYNELVAKREAEKAGMKPDPAKPEPPTPGKKPPVPAKKKLSAESTAWRNLRKVLADFFDPAP